MNFQDDDQTAIESETITINDNFDIVSVRFQMKQSEFDLIKGGLKADLVSFMEWLEESTID